MPIPKPDPYHDHLIQLSRELATVAAGFIPVKLARARSPTTSWRASTTSPFSAAMWTASSRPWRAPERPHRLPRRSVPVHRPARRRPRRQRLLRDRGGRADVRDAAEVMDADADISGVVGRKDGGSVMVNTILHEVKVEDAITVSTVGDLRNALTLLIGLANETYLADDYASSASAHS